MKRIIDSHLDLAWNAVSWDRDLRASVAAINRREAGMEDDKSRGNATTSFPELRRGRVAVCLVTVLSRSRPETFPRPVPRRVSLDHGHPAAAYADARGQLAYYHLMEAEGQVKLLYTAGDLEAHWARWDDEDPMKSPIGVILSMEGADPIVTVEQAEEWWRAGLRSVSLVHYGHNRYAAGTGDSGPITAEGRRLLREFERLGLMLDVTHLCDESFFQALDSFAGPVLASHNNCRTLVPGDRQFSDEQIRLLIERQAVIGAALDAWMLHADWKIGETSRQAVSLDAVADHVDHICQLAGNTSHVAIGSDLDGGFGTEQVPAGLETIADLQKLDGILASRGYEEDDVAAILHGNWLRFLGRHLPVTEPDNVGSAS